MLETVHYWIGLYFTYLIRLTGVILAVAFLSSPIVLLYLGFMYDPSWYLVAGIQLVVGIPATIFLLLDDMV